MPFPPVEMLIDIGPNHHKAANNNTRKQTEREIYFFDEQLCFSEFEKRGRKNCLWLSLL